MFRTCDQSRARKLQTRRPLLPYQRTPQPDPTVLTAEELKKLVLQPEQENRLLSQLFRKPYTITTRITRPLGAILTGVGEKAMLKLGLTSPVAPSLHLNPSWNHPSLNPLPGTKEFFTRKAAESRKQAQKYAKKADSWRQEMEDMALGLSEIKDERENKKRRKLLRQAERRIEWYQERAWAGMAVAYLNAIMAGTMLEWGVVFRIR